MSSNKFFKKIFNEKFGKYSIPLVSVTQVLMVASGLLVWACGPVRTSTLKNPVSLNVVDTGGSTEVVSEEDPIKKLAGSWSLTSNSNKILTFSEKGDHLQIDTLGDCHTRNEWSVSYKTEKDSSITLILRPEGSQKIITDSRGSSSIDPVGENECSGKIGNLTKQSLNTIVTPLLHSADWSAINFQGSTYSKVEKNQ